MPCSNNHNKFYQSVGKLVSLFVTFISVFVILLSFFYKEKLSQDRLRCSYDGLSPTDYK